MQQMRRLLPGVMWIFMLACGGGSGSSDGQEDSLDMTDSNPDGQEALVDQESPTTPSQLKAELDGLTSAKLNWLGSTDNVGIAGYKVFDKGVEIGTSTLTSFVHEGLVAGSEHCYTVRAFDQAGNVSEPSNEACAIDVNECATNNGGCAQVCTNSVGSYACSCNTGYPVGANCAACTPITGCTASLTCTSSSDQQCTACTAGMYLVNNTADTCAMCNGDCSTCDDAGNCPVYSIEVNPATLLFVAAEGEENPSSQSFTVQNTGAINIPDLTISKDTSWLAVSPTSGTLTPGQSLTVSVDADNIGLGTGTYSGTITVLDKEITVTFVVGLNALLISDSCTVEGTAPSYTYTDVATGYAIGPVGTYLSTIQSLLIEFDCGQWSHPCSGSIPIDNACIRMAGQPGVTTWAQTYQTSGSSSTYNINPRAYVSFGGTSMLVEGGTQCPGGGQYQTVGESFESSTPSFDICP